ncbi:MAG: hypothetical protein P8Y38_00815, partial [Deltaproteobacteria bacterium]
MSDKQTGKPGLFFRLLKWSVAVAGLVLMIAWTGGVFHPKVQAAKLAYRPGKPLPDKAKTYTVHLKKIAPRIDVVGTVASEENVHLSARISAYVSKVNVSAGTAVKKG